jgi:hypothetical protein
MPLYDRNFAHKRMMRFIPIYHFVGSQVTGSSTVLDGMGTGAPVWSELSTFGYAGINMEQGDMIACIDWETLQVADLREEIGVRVRWTGDATPASGDDVTWIALYNQANQNAAYVEPATALDTAIANHNPGHTTALSVQRTARGVINANTFDEAAREGQFSWRIEADVIDAYGATEVHFLALEVDYIPQYFSLPNDVENIHTKRTDSENA